MRSFFQISKEARLTRMLRPSTSRVHSCAIAYARARLTLSSSWISFTVRYPLLICRPATYFDPRILRPSAARSPNNRGSFSDVCHLAHCATFQSATLVTPLHWMRSARIVDGMSGSRPRGSASTGWEKVVEGDDPSAGLDDSVGDLETDALDVPIFDSTPSRLTHTCLGSGRPLRKTSLRAPPTDLLSNVHVDHDSNRNLIPPGDSGSMTAIAFIRLPNMHDDRLTPEMAKRVIDLVEDQIAKRFRPPPGKTSYPGGQRAIAEAMHIAQPTLNRLRNHGQGIGLDLVLGLRAYFRDIGHPMTIDEILWEHEAGARPASEDVLARLMELEERAKAFVESPPSKKEARKYWEEVQRLRLTVAGTIGAQRAAAAAKNTTEDVPAETYDFEHQRKLG